MRYLKVAVTAFLLFCLAMAAANAQEIPNVQNIPRGYIYGEWAHVTSVLCDTEEELTSILSANLLGGFQAGNMTYILFNRTPSTVNPKEAACSTASTQFFIHERVAIFKNYAKVDGTVADVYLTHVFYINNGKLREGYVFLDEDVMYGDGTA